MSWVARGPTSEPGSTFAAAEAIKCAIAQNLSTVSLSVGSDVSKTRWGARPVASAEGLECWRSLRSQIAYEAHQRALEFRGKRTPGWATALAWLPQRDW